MNMNISCRIANANTQCGRITNPPERTVSMVEEFQETFESVSYNKK